jgi:hypothetical protein
MQRTLVWTFLALSLAGPAAAQTLEGRVVDARTGQAVPQASVTVLGRTGRAVERARSDDAGNFAIRLEGSGTYRLRAERLGYRASVSDTVSVANREAVEVTLRVSPEELALEALTVTRRREPPRLRALDVQGFYAREAAGFGKFMRREDFADRGTTDMVHLLTREPSLNSYVDGRGKWQVFFNRSNASPYERSGFGIPRDQRTGNLVRGNSRRANQPCQPRIYLDGTPMMLSSEVTINEVISPEQVEAVEFYRGPSETPSRFAYGDTSCGVIVIWSRTGGSRDSG